MRINKKFLEPNQNKDSRVITSVSKPIKGYKNRLLESISFVNTSDQTTVNLSTDSDVWGRIKLVKKSVTNVTEQQKSLSIPSVVSLSDEPKNEKPIPKILMLSELPSFQKLIDREDKTIVWVVVK